MYFTPTKQQSFPVVNSANDFYYQVCDFGSYDVSVLTDRANDYNLHTSDIIEYTFDTYSKEQIFEDAVSINYFFDSLYTMRIHQLQDYTRQAIEKIDYILNNDFSCSDESEHTEGYYQTQKTLSTLNKLLHFLEHEANDKIHLNACCSSFDCEILDALECVKHGDDVIDVVGHGKIYIPSN
jgi:hypothetical protein